MRTNNDNKDFVLCNTLDDCKEYFDIMLFALFSIIRSTPRAKVKSRALADAKILLQMMFLKCLNIRQMLDGVGIEQRIGKESYALPHIIDHASILSLTRDLYESFCILELLFIFPDSEEKKEIIYKLFVMNGLNERQKFFHSESYEDKKEQEKCQIEELAKEIRASSLYIKLDPENKNKLNQHINNCWFRIIIDKNNNIKKFKWEKDYELFRIKRDVFADAYGYLSTYSHPSFLSIMQFRTAFDNDKSENEDYYLLAIRYVIELLSFTIADSLELFPEIKKEFERMDTTIQALILFYNNSFREKDYFSE